MASQGISGTLAANLAVQATATAIPVNQLFTNVTTADANNTAVLLPSLPANGVVYKIRNSGGAVGANVLIFPGTGASINGGAANASYSLSPGSTVEMVSTGSLTWVAFAIGDKTSFISSVGTGGAVGPTAAQNRSVIFASNGDAATTITLPAPFAGAYYKVINGAAKANIGSVAVACGAGNLFGVIMVNGALVACNAAANCNFIKNISLQGDLAEFVSDGTKWYVNASSGGGAGAITAT